MAQHQALRLLLVAGAQHPLRGGTVPGDEFTDRLTRTAELARTYHDLGWQVEIFVPGSRHRHRHRGGADGISLTAAGVHFLAQQGLPAAVTVRGPDLNRRYKGEAGVYNTADECFVAARHFLAGDFGRLIYVASSAQATRAGLHFLWAGIEAQQDTGPGTYHRPWAEKLLLVPYTRWLDPSWQGRFSPAGRLFRRLRRPANGSIH